MLPASAGEFVLQSLGIVGIAQFLLKILPYFFAISQ